MKWDRLLFAVFLALGLVVALLILAVPEADGERGRPHPEFTSMDQGGSGARHERLLGWGYVFGALSIVSIAAFTALGASRRNGSLRGLGGHLLWGTGLFLAVWTLLMLAYRGNLRNQTGDLLLYFPVASALMLYLLYPVSTLYNIFFVTGFKRWVLSDDDHRSYRRLVADAGRVEEDH